MDNIVISGQPSIIIRCGSAFSIGSTNFAAGQMVACINDCDVQFTYKKNEKNMSSGVKTYGYGEYIDLASVRIRSVPFNKMLTKIVFGRTQGTINRPHIIVKKSDAAGKIAIPYIGTISNVEVQDLDYNNINFTIDTTTNIITIAANTTARICYYTPMSNGYKINTTPTPLPYFTLEVIAKGSEIGDDRNTITQILKINKAALQLDPFFAFDNSISNFDMNFVIIKDNEDYIGYGS